MNTWHVGRIAVLCMYTVIVLFQEMKVSTKSMQKKAEYDNTLISSTCSICKFPYRKSDNELQFICHNSGIDKINMVSKSSILVK